MDEVVTGEAVVLDVPVARFPSRMLALVVDLVAQLVLLFTLFLLTGAATAGGLDPASAAAIGLACVVLTIVGYPATFETLSRGRSLGKLWLGLRVVSDDGGPERFRQALVRALMAVPEIWMTLGFLALLTSLLSAKGKRLGDMLAGTFVIQERLPGRRMLAAPLATVPPALVDWASTLHLAGLTDATAETARGYLSRFHELTPAARQEFGQRIAATVQAQVSPAAPPGTTPTDYLTAILAERRSREHARMMAYGPSAAGPGQFAAPQPSASQPSAPEPSASEASTPQPSTPQPSPSSWSALDPPPSLEGQQSPGSQPPREAADPAGEGPAEGRPGGFLPPV
ncbi:MAG: hypothetical protein QOJ73_2223 [Streptosporangiaceae bacterium]|nr:hypothetical protein [Streptosporangiaceae bacterium]